MSLLHLRSRIASVNAVCHDNDFNASSSVKLEPVMNNNFDFEFLAWLQTYITASSPAMKAIET